MSERWEEALRALVKRIEESSTPYDEDDFKADLAAKLQALREEGYARATQLGEVLCRRAAKELTTAAAIDEVRPLADGDDKVALQALTHAARWSLGLLQPSVHREFRQRGLALAIRLSNVQARTIIHANWAFAAFDEGEIDEAEEHNQRAEQLILDSQWPQDAKWLETRARLRSHHAKILLARARREPEPTAAVASAVADYEAAIHLVRKYEHWRVNLQIELAAELTRLARERDEVAEAPIRASLLAASQALAAHVCSDCRAYYAETDGLVHELAADRSFNHDALIARTELELARASLLDAVAKFEAGRHHLGAKTRRWLARVNRKLADMKKPKRIFLSHAGVDKAHVRRFYDVLANLGFEPWLDDADMEGGATLEQRIAEGMQKSCAAVFLITPSFKDARFLNSEIRYALAAMRDNECFRIIPIRLDSAAEVPFLLQPYVYKHASGDLDILVQILSALPVRVGTVIWRPREE